MRICAFCMVAFLARGPFTRNKVREAERARQGSLLRDVRHIRADGWHRINGITGSRECSQACTGGLPIYLRRKYVYVKRKNRAQYPQLNRV